MSAYVPSKIKPKLRGVFHFIGFCTAAVSSVALLFSPKTGEAYAGGVIYAATLVIMLGLSALYHRPMWSHGARRVLRRIDHSGIFFLIAGSYTAFWTLTPEANRSTWQLIVMWACVAVGVVSFVFWTDMHRGLRATVYVVLGLSTLPLVRDLPHAGARRGRDPLLDHRQEPLGGVTRKGGRVCAPVPRLWVSGPAASFCLLTQGDRARRIELFEISRRSEAFVAAGRGDRISGADRRRRQFLVMVSVYGPVFTGAKDGVLIQMSTLVPASRCAG